MEKRCYLFGSDQLPDGLQPLARDQLQEIGSWPGEVPLLFKILCSVDTRLCPSVLYHPCQDQAVLADFSLGLAELQRFLQKIRHPQLQSDIRLTLELLQQPELQHRYLVLETSEIFSHGAKTKVWQNMQLCQQLRQLAGEMTLTLQQLQLPQPLHSQMKKPGLLARLLGVPARPWQPDQQQLIRSLGFTAWVTNRAGGQTRLEASVESQPDLAGSGQLC
jgi:hypothetical protein